MADLLARLQSALVDRYAIERELGAGGMASVYLAQDLKHHRPVAIKVLKPELAVLLGPERFLREIEIAARLTHPHILPLLDSGEADGLVYYVMPFVEGESLRSRLEREAQLPVEDAVRIGREVAEALDYAHRHNVVHRDIKPENIMLEDGQAVVADFGIARAIGAAGGDQLTQTGITIGTPAYMSPEQAAGSHGLDGRSDLYSLGCVVYEMLAGQPPFTGPSPERVIHQHLSLRAVPVTALRPIVPAGIGQVLARVLEKAPADRYSTAAQFAAALEGHAVLAPRGPLSRRPWHALYKPGLVAGAVVVVVGGAWAAWRARQPSALPMSSSALAVLPFQVAGPNLEFWREGMVDLFSIDLNGAAGLRAIPARTILSRWHRELGARAEEADQDAALRVAKGVGARYALVGSVVGSGSNVRLSADVYDLPTGAHEPTAQVEGPADSIPALVDRLSLDLLRGGVVRGTEAPPTFDLRGITTRSLPALKAYLEGEQEFRRAHPREAVDHFKQAVEADSTFALAWYRLSLAQGWISSPHRWSPEPVDTSYDHLAARFATRLSDRDQRLLLGSAQLDKGDPLAVSTLEELTRLYPDEVDGWFLLADADFHLGGALRMPRDSFRSASRRALELDPDFAPGYVHLVEDAFDRLDSSDARRLVDRVREIDPSSPKAVGFGIAYALVWGNMAEKQAAIAALDTASADALLAAKHATNYTPDLWRQTVQTASALVQQSRYPQEIRLWALEGRTVAYWLRGRMHDAERSYTAGFITITGHKPDEDPQGWLGWWLWGYPDSVGLGRVLRQLATDTSIGAHYLIGAAMARQQRWTEAAHERRWLDSMGARARARHDTLAATTFAAYSLAVLGIETASRGDSKMAIRELTAADSGFVAMGGRSRTVLATLERLLVGAREFREAQRYLTATDFTLYAIRVPGEFYIGEVYEGLGDRERAKLHYGNFVRWWQDCDPELRPWWEEGRQALTRVTQEMSRP